MTDWLKKHQSAMQTIRRDKDDILYVANLLDEVGNEKLAEMLFDTAKSLRAAEVEASGAISDMLTEGITTQHQSMKNLFTAALSAAPKK